MRRGGIADAEKRGVHRLPGFKGESWGGCQLSEIRDQKKTAG